MRSSGVAFSSRLTSPLIKPRPRVVSFSWPVSANSCMPRQMPRIGLSARTTASRIASDRPSALSRSIATGNAPTPGSSSRPAVRTVSGSRVMTTSAPQYSSARATESMLERPESMIVTALIPRGRYTLSSNCLVRFRSRSLTSWPFWSVLNSFLLVQRSQTRSNSSTVMSNSPRMSASGLPR